MTKPITIEQHFMTNLANANTSNADIMNILYDINVAAKLIRQKVVRAGLQHDILGASGHTNASGEDTQSLDIYANSIIKEVLSAHGRISYMGSEEDHNVVTTRHADNSNHVILFDPLDGSSNIDVNVSVGTIFSIFKKNSLANHLDEQCCQIGAKQVAAGYVIYGSSVVMVYTTGSGVHGFTYDPSIGEFLLSHPNITIPDTPRYYSINESLYHQCTSHTQSHIDQLKSQLSLRYVGSLVADFHRNLLKGGIYIYPGTTKNPNGKLRLLYEANPLAFICEQAGGLATNGVERIMDIAPTSLHQRVPLYIGSSDLVTQCLASFAAHGTSVEPTPHSDTDA